jgi:hypothetical protein
LPVLKKFSAVFRCYVNLAEREGCVFIDINGNRSGKKRKKKVVEGKVSSNRDIWGVWAAGHEGMIRQNGCSVKGMGVKKG